MRENYVTRRVRIDRDMRKLDEESNAKYTNAMRSQQPFPGMRLKCRATGKVGYATGKVLKSEYAPYHPSRYEVAWDDSGQLGHIYVVDAIAWRRIV